MHNAEKLNIKNKKPKTQAQKCIYLSNRDIFMFLICVFNLWFLVFNFKGHCS